MAAVAVVMVLVAGELGSAEVEHAQIAEMHRKVRHPLQRHQETERWERVYFAMLAMPCRVVAPCSGMSRNHRHPHLGEPVWMVVWEVVPPLASLSISSQSLPSEWEEVEEVHHVVLKYWAEVAALCQGDSLSLLAHFDPRSCPHRNLNHAHEI